MAASAPKVVAGIAVMVFAALALVYAAIATVPSSAAALVGLCLAWGVANHLGLSLIIGRLAAPDRASAARSWGSTAPSPICASSAARCCTTRSSTAMGGRPARSGRPPAHPGDDRRCGGGCGKCGGAGPCDDRGAGRSLVEAIYGFAEATRFGPFRRNPKMAASVGEGDVFRAFRSTAECHVRKSHISSGLAAVRT